MKKSLDTTRFFRRLSHPRKNIHLSDESIQHLLSKGKTVPPVSPDAVHMELLNYVDPYDIGIDIGQKHIRHALNKQKLNDLFFSKKTKFSDYDTDPVSRRLWNRLQYIQYAEIKKHKFNTTMVYTHLLSQKRYYYTSNPFSSIRLLGADIDNHTQDPNAVSSFLDFFQQYFPNSFYDRGSSGKSLHYYIKMDIVPLYHYFTQSYKGPESWSSFANSLIRYTGYIFKLYGQKFLYPDYSLVNKTSIQGTSKQIPYYDVEFDAFKGTYPEYQYYINQQGHPVITEMLKTGTLHKLPQIDSVNTFIKFQDSPVFSIINYFFFSNFLSSLLLHSGLCSQKELKQVETALNAIDPVLKAHTVFPSLCSGKSSVLLPPESVYQTSEEESNKKLCIYTGTFSNGDDSFTEPDAYLRSRQYLYSCYKNYIIMKGREPTKNEFRKEYRKNAGTGTEDTEDKNRLDYIYDNYIEKMRTYTFGSLSEQLNRIQLLLPLTQEEINQKSSYNRKLTTLDLSIAALWISLCLTHPEYLDKKHWSSLHQSEHYGRELTVPMVSLEKFFECLKAKGLSSTGCNHHKAKALREVLVDIGWIQCVDDTVVVAAQYENKGGRSRRYILLPEHPQYHKFETIVGSDRIAYWRLFRAEQLKKREQFNKGEHVPKKTAS